MYSLLFQKQPKRRIAKKIIQKDSAIYCTGVFLILKKKTEINCLFVCLSREKENWSKLFDRLCPFSRLYLCASDQSVEEFYKKCHNRSKLANSTLLNLNVSLRLFFHILSCLLVPLKPFFDLSNSTLTSYLENHISTFVLLQSYHSLFLPKKCFFPSSKRKPFHLGE